MIRKRKVTLWAFLILSISVFIKEETSVSDHTINYEIHNVQTSVSDHAIIDEILNGKKEIQEDLFALTHWDMKSNKLMQQIKLDQKEGNRDKFFLPNEYEERLNNKHFNDIGNSDNYQKEVYLTALILARKLVSTTESGDDVDGAKNTRKKRGLVLDIGAGSGFKLVKYLSPEFNTIGFETEPAISHLRKTYPDEQWVNSGEPGESMPSSWNGGGKIPDVCVCSDVVEHIRNPNELLKFLYSLNCRSYVISTPKREGMIMEPWNSPPNGPPRNKAHVREWTRHEFVAYLESQQFTVVRSFDGIQHFTSQFVVAVKRKN